MDLTKAAKAALNTLVDIASHSMNGQPVPVPELAKRQKLSISRIELLLRPLRESGFVKGTKGRRGGYVLSQDPRLITIKDIVLAMNLIKKRKVEISDIAKELYQSLEAYMLSCMANGTLASAIQECVPSFSDVRNAPEPTAHNPLGLKKERRQKGMAQKVIKEQFQKAAEVPRGPNSVFEFAYFLNRHPS